MLKKSENSRLDDTFYTALVLKAVDSVLEIIGGILLLLINPNTINHLATNLTQQELSEDPHDFVANRILKTSHDLASTSGRYFAAFYLLSHGLVKIFLIVALFKQKLWAYPAFMVVIGLFIVYQLYRLSYKFSVGLTLLTLFDLLVIWLTWREYQKHRARLAASS